MAKKDNLKFEDALKKLENVVGKLEDGELSLEGSLEAFGEGIELSKFCQQKLEEAEKKIEILEKDKSGKVKRKPFATGDEDAKSNAKS